MAQTHQGHAPQHFGTRAVALVKELEEEQGRRLGRLGRHIFLAKEHDAVVQRSDAGTSVRGIKNLGYIREDQLGCLGGGCNRLVHAKGVI